MLVKRAARPATVDHANARSRRPARRLKGPAWLESAIFYEIYPQSFLDTNGDGIGDLPGIIRKLDYIASLGCTAIWLNPCWVSPFGDAGYDVADFCRAAPRYGTNADLRRLFREAHRRGLRVCLDLVAGHTSIEHPWFKASSRPEPNDYSNWYLWSSSVWEEVPNFSTVQGYSRRDGRYIANFFHFQPALNFGFAHPDPRKPWQLPVDHPDVRSVRAEMKRIMRYWLDAGADGFRVDMASSLVKGDTGYTKTMAWWQEVRAMCDRDYPEAALISEWSSPRHAIAAGFHVDFLIHFGSLAYTTLFRHESRRDIFGVRDRFGHSFFDRSGQGDVTHFLTTYLRHYRSTRGKGYISIPSGNHDIGRLSEGRTLAELKVIFAFLLTLPGIPCIYYGDEIGLRHVHGLPSKEGGFGRTGARTPMQWTRGRNAGFSSAPKNRLYLPQDPKNDRPTVDEQFDDPGSLLHHVRHLANLRAKSPALGGDGDFKPLYAKSRRCPLVFLRRNGEERFVVAVNPAKTGQTLILRMKAGSIATWSSAGASLTKTKTGVRLQMTGVSYGIFRLLP